MILNNVASDCLVCTLRVIFSMGMLSGSYAISFKCPHSRNPVATPKFLESKVLLLSSLIVVLPLIIHIGFCAYELSSLSVKDEWNIIAKLAIIFTNIESFGFAIPSIIKYKEKLTELNGLNSIIENRKFYGIHTLLTKEMARRFIIECYLIVIGFMIVNTWVTAKLILSKPAFEPSTDFCFRVAITLANNYIQYFGSLQLMLTNQLYRCLFRRCFQQIKSVLRRRNLELLKHKESFLIKEIIVALPENMPFEENIKRLRDLYTSLVHNYRQLNKFIFPSVLIWWLVTTIMYIINSYVTVLLYSSNIGDIKIYLEMYTSVIGIIIFLHFSQEVIDAVSNKLLRVSGIKGFFGYLLKIENQFLFKKSL